MKRKRYEIGGMNCAACVSHVERAAGKVLLDRADFTVSLLTNSLLVHYGEEVSDAEIAQLEKRLKKEIGAAGYSLSQAEEPSKKPKDTKRKELFRLLFSVFFTLFTVYVSMSGMLSLPMPSLFRGVEGAFWSALLQALLCTPVLLLHKKQYRNGFSALFHGAPNMDSLIAVGSGAAALYGLVSTVMLAFAREPEVIQSWMKGLYFESAAMILTLVSFGKWLESGAKEKAADAVRDLARLSPKYAVVCRDGVEKRVAVEEIEIGDLLRIRAGDLIAVDGEIVSGEATVDESALTGESMPIDKKEGDSVCAACVLTSGAVLVRATRVGEDTSLARIVRLLEDAAASKAPIARIADRVSSVFVPCVMAISALTLVLWLLFTGKAEPALRSAISVLVISCPCALGLATPTAITVAVGRGARRGILFQNAEALEKLCQVQRVAFDKTGTLTEGKPALTELYTYGESAHKVLRLAGSVEKLSPHIIAIAIQNAAERVFEGLPEALNYRETLGFGAEALVENIQCKVGKPDAAFRAKVDAQKEATKTLCSSTPFGDLLSAQVCEFDDRERIFADFYALENAGKTAVLVTFNGLTVGILGISDRPRLDSKTAVDALKGANLKTCLLTGDNPKTAAYVANAVGLDEYRSSLLPEEKERVIREWSEQAPVAMVGDGINDAPALARADVGIAIGAGTEVAIDSADLVLSSSSPMGVWEAYALSRATVRIIRQNLFWALFYNAVCIPVAAGLFFPVFGWQLSPMLGSAAMSLSSLCVVTNALRLRYVSLDPQNVKHKQKRTAASQSREKSVAVPKKGESNMLFAKPKTYTLSIEGMMCQHCVAHVKKALESVRSTKSVEVSLDQNSATVTTSASPDALTKAVTDAGYTVTSITE